MAKLFISYSREDKKRVRDLAGALERAGHEVWWDQHIAGGEEYSGAIEEALESADAVIVAWSAAAVKSAWVRDEAAAGRDRGCLVPVTIDGSAPPLGFRQYQLIDLSRWNGRPNARELQPLKAALEARCGVPRPAPGAAATRPDQPAARRRLVQAAAAFALLIAVGGFAYSRLIAGGGGIEPRVSLGEFVTVSAAVPAELPQMLGQEMLAAFGAENAVSVVTSGASGEDAPFVMDGSLSPSGKGVRITVNLKNRRTGVLLWSNAYEHEVADAVAARQAGVGASQVVRCGLWGAANYKRPMSDEALGLYLKWCGEHWSGSDRPAAELDAARRVTAALPDFSFGWSARALAAVPLALESTSAEAEQLRKEAEDAAKRSIALDDDNPEGYMALAGLVPLDRYAERERLLKKAISVRETECGCERQAYGDFLASVGRMEEAAEQYERARAMRPLAPFSNLRFAQALYVIGRANEADQVLAKTMELWPEATSLQLLKMKSALWTGRYDEAIAILGNADLPLTSDQRDALAEAFAALKSANSGRQASAADRLQQFAADPRRNDRIVVAALAALGARDAALKAAANLVRSRGLWETEVLFEPNLARAKGEPAYAALVRGLGLTGYWRSGAAPDICRDRSGPQFCAMA